METILIKLDKHNINTEELKIASGTIKSGGLVAFPTETVYGLGANAFDENAVKHIFAAKGRPNDNPLIVHVSDKNIVRKIVEEISPKALRLMNYFWPGPLTIIMKKSKEISLSVTAGLNTVAIRMPSHPVALALIRESGIPIAAPSANSSGRPSPTNAEHVIEDLWGRVDVIIDAGPAEVGLESTVIDTTVDPPVILRPGGISLSEISEVIGDTLIDPSVMLQSSGKTPRSPGMKYRHYSPAADMTVVEGKLENTVRKIKELIDEYRKEGYSIGVLATDQTKANYNDAFVISLGNRDDLQAIAANLFNSLREFDKQKIDFIFAEAVNMTEIGTAIMNRMYKAAGYKIINV